MFSLMHIFSLNNAHYILKNIRSSPELLNAIGENSRVIADIDQRYKLSFDCYKLAT